MNRRNFIGQLAGILAASAAPGLFLAEATDHFHWKAPPGRLVAVINPEWLDAPFEVAFMIPPQDLLPALPEDCLALLREKHIVKPPPGAYPFRFRTLIDAAFNENPIQPWILKKG